MSEAFGVIDYSDIQSWHTEMTIYCDTGYATTAMKITEYQYQYLLLDVKSYHGQLLYVTICTSSNILMSVEGLMASFLFWVKEMGIYLSVQVQNPKYL